MASDSAVCESCWRVLRASRLAPSAFESAETRLSAPCVRTFDSSLVKSWRVWATERFEPRAEASERSVLEAYIAAKYEESRRLSLWNQSDYANVYSLASPGSEHAGESDLH